ncbi:MAG: hypothetical protein RJB60_3044 [Pseudomonadota bacterium]|jgi:hypothetical protein
MLNSFEVAQALLDRGFVSLTHPERTKAHGYAHPELAHAVYVKVGGTKGALLPVSKFPLVLHPDAAALWRDAAPATSGFVLQDKVRTGTGYLLFASHVNEVGTPYGYACSFEDESALDQFLEVLKSLNARAYGPSAATMAQALMAARHLDGQGTGHDDCDTDEDDSEAFAMDEIEQLSVDDYLQAYEAARHRMTVPQHRMLIGHANAAGHTLSMQAIAELGGYDSFSAANSQYGTLAAYMLEAAGIQGLSQKMEVLAHKAPERSPQGHWQWAMRPALVEALRQLGLLNDAITALQAQAAQAEIDSDPQCQGVDATTRMALVEARVGQGAYRRGLMEVWSGRCSVTGVDIPEVLIASHAKSWKRSANEERLDPHNGLLLVASIDKLFDKGLISFDDQGCLLTKEDLPSEHLHLLGLSPQSRLRAVPDRLRPYLADHRSFHGFVQA